MKLAFAVFLHFCFVVIWVGRICGKHFGKILPLSSERFFRLKRCCKKDAEHAFTSFGRKKSFFFFFVGKWKMIVFRSSQVTFLKQKAFETSFSQSKKMLAFWVFRWILEKSCLFFSFSTFTQPKSFRFRTFSLNNYLYPWCKKNLKVPKKSEQSFQEPPCRCWFLTEVSSKPVQTGFCKKRKRAFLTSCDIESKFWFGFQQHFRQLSFSSQQTFKHCLVTKF